jgi:adenylyltransferase/sulfurtransferase
VDGGVLGVLPGVIGTLQATEAIKLIAGVGEPLLGKLLHFDALTATSRTFKLRPDPQCALCGDRPTITEPKSIGGAPPCAAGRTTVVELKAALDAGGIILLDVREPDEREACKIEPSIAIPLAELAKRLAELPREQPLYVHCKAGGRSARAVAQLVEFGFENAIDVLGGIDAWRAEVDPGLPDA